MDLVFIIFIVAAVFVFLFLIELILIVVLIAMTPGGTFLLAWIRKMPVIALRHKDVTAEFLCGKRRLGNFVEVKKKGFFELQKGTGNFDMKSKVMWYDCITEQAASQGLWKAALVKELRDAGYEINSWQDLRYLMACAKDKEWISKEYRRLKAISGSIADKFKLLVKNIRRNTVDVFSAKSYKISELFNLFPNEMSPANVHEATVLAVQMDRKLRDKNIMAYVMGFFIICLGAGLAYVLFTSNSTPEVIVRVSADALMNGSSMLKG